MYGEWSRTGERVEAYVDSFKRLLYSRGGEGAFMDDSRGLLNRGKGGGHVGISLGISRTGSRGGPYMGGSGGSNTERGRDM